MKTFSLFALLASVALAAPAPAPAAGVISQDSTGYIVKPEVIQHYTRLCQAYPAMGDKPGDGVFIVDEGIFHLDTKHFNDYVAMSAREQAVVAENAGAASQTKSAN